MSKAYFQAYYIKNKIKLLTNRINRYENNKISIKKQKNENYKNNENLRIKNRNYQKQRYETNKQYYRDYYNTIRQDEDKRAKNIEYQKQRYQNNKIYYKQYYIEHMETIKEKANINYIKKPKKPKTTKKINPKSLIKPFTEEQKQFHESNKTDDGKYLLVF